MAGKKLLIIDEAQVIPNIGKVLKLMIDRFDDLTIIATGSSAFDLSNQTGEPLTGSSYKYYLYPISQQELFPLENALETKQNLDDRLVFVLIQKFFNHQPQKIKKNI